MRANSTIVGLVLVILAVREPARAGPGDRALDQYFRSLNELSDVSLDARPWDYFGTNELSFHENYPALQGRSGAIVGVGFQQNFSLAIRSEATGYVILDIEPTVAALVPFFGILMDRHPTRKAFLSRLMGVELTDQEFRWLVEPDHVEQQQEKSLEEYLKTRVAEIVRRVPSDTRRRNMETLRRLMLDEVLVRSQIPSSRHSQILSNLSSLLDAEKSLTDYPARVLPADKERGLLEFLHNHASVTFFSKTTVDRQARATWFATEENYARTRQMWLSGRFIGMTADMTGSMVALLGRWLRDRDLTVSAIYVSNVPEYYSGNERHALFDNLRQLPLDPDAVILMTRRSKFDLYPMIRPFGAGGRWRFRITALSLLILGVSIVALAVWKGRQANSRASGANVDTGPG